MSTYIRFFQRICIDCFVQMFFCATLIYISSYSTLSSESIKIAAASDLQFALEEIKREFIKENSEHRVDIVYGSSGILYQQISNGAPFDLFFSADDFYPQHLKKNKNLKSNPVQYAIGNIVLWSKKIDVQTNQMNSLNFPSIRKIAIANPEHAPYGKRAKESMEYFGQYQKLKSKLIFGENISQTAHYVLSGNADIGIIALSLAMSPKMKSKGTYYHIPENSYSQLNQTCILISDSNLAQKFQNYVRQKSVHNILTKYGFRIP